MTDRSAAVDAVVAVLNGAEPDDTDDGESLAELRETATALVYGLEATGWRIRPAPPLPAGMARVEILAHAQFAQMGPEGKIRIEGPPEPQPGAFLLTPDRVWLGVILQPGRVYEIRPESRILVPPGAVQ